MSGVVVDIGAFRIWADVYEKAVLDAMERGAGKAASALLNDSQTEFPAVPLDEGTLRGSGSVFVNNKLTEIAERKGGSPTPATENDDPIPPDAIVAVVGYNTPYAAYQHEGIREDGTHKVQNYTHSGVGPKFLEAPNLENAEAYTAIVAAEVRKVTG